MDDAVRLAASLDEPAEANHVRAHVQADLAAHGDERRATTRIEAYTVWGGYAYGRELDGRPAADSDDYFQYHGGMVATVRALRGTAPEPLGSARHRRAAAGGGVARDVGEAGPGGAAGTAADVRGDRG